VTDRLLTRMICHRLVKKQKHYKMDSQHTSENTTAANAPYKQLMYCKHITQPRLHGLQDDRTPRTTLQAGVEHYSVHGTWFERVQGGLQ